jgi:outer membrane protein assembly factor BamB
MLKKLFLPVLLLALPLLIEAQKDPSREWPSYRGYMLSGVLDDAHLPDTFDPATGKNIAWKTDIPGLGISSPVIWGRDLFITTAVSEADKAGFKPGIFGSVEPVDDSSIHTWKLFCLDKTTGKIRWERDVCKGIPAIKRHPKSTHANCSVATDGKYVVAFFGSEGLYCYNIKGDLIWKKNFGILKSVFFMMRNAEWEFASSPFIYKDKLLIQCDVLEDSFVSAFDLATGNEIWKTGRNDYPGWCTPNVYTSGEKDFVVLNGYNHIAAYDLNTGKEKWFMSGGGDIPIPSPVIGNDLIYLNSSHKGSPIFAVSKSAEGEITLKNGETSNAYIKWMHPRGGSYMQTLLLYHDKLYNVNWNGVVNCYDPLTGNEIFNCKLGKSKSFIASPVASDGRIFIVDEEGTVYIIKDGDTFSQLAEIPLNDICMCAPAITDGMIFFRTQHGIIAAGNK